VPKKFNNPIRDAVGSVLARPRLNRLARELGVVKRQRKVCVVAFFAAVVLGFSTGAQRTLAGMRRAYEKATGRSLRLASTPGSTLSWCSSCGGLWMTRWHNCNSRRRD